MPIPKPGDNEAQSDFISRCMGDKVMVADFDKQEQRAAVCHQAWRDRHKQTTKDVRDALDGLRLFIQKAKARLES